MREPYLGEVLEWKYGLVADTAGGKITAWRHKTIQQPDEAQLAQDTKEYKAYLAANAYKPARAKEMPPAGDQLGAIWEAIKALQAAAGLADLPKESEDVLTAIEAVKDKYPKPEDAPVKSEAKIK